MSFASPFPEQGGDVQDRPGYCPEALISDALSADGAMAGSQPVVFSDSSADVGDSTGMASRVSARSIVFRDDAAPGPEPDSLMEPPRPKPRLLPDNLSLMERVLWGEDGLVRSIGIASPLTPEVRKHELDVRRTMLTMHQIGGFVTLGSMLTTAYFGQRYLDKGLRRDRDLHQAFVATTLISYGLTAALSVLSPPPLIRRDEFSTTTLHKTLAWVHFAGMIVTPLLGSAIEHSRGGNYFDRARYHQVSAYITTAVFAASLIVITI